MYLTAGFLQGDIQMDLQENTRLIFLAKPLYLGEDLANGKSADILYGVFTLTWVKDVFLFDSRSFGFAQVGVTFACDLILHGEMHHCEAGTCFSTFLAQMTPHSQKRGHINALSPCLSVSVGHTLTTCAHRLRLLIE